MSTDPSAPPSEPGILTVPGHCFFARLIDLPTEILDKEIDAYARLNLESVSPFPPAHLAAGWHRFAGTQRLLIFGAYRKSFPDSSLALWDDAHQVIPDFAPALLLKPVGPRPNLVLWRTAESVTGLLWTSASEAPEAVLSRRLPETAEEATPEALAAVFAQRFNSTLSTLRLTVWKPAESGALREERTRLAVDAVAVVGDAPGSATVTGAHLDSWDVRPAEFLLAARAERRRAELLWRGVLGAVGIAALLLFAEIGSAALGTWNTRRAKLIQSRADAVKAVDDSLKLATRLDELTNAQLRPFDKLAILGEAQPNSIYFTRASSQGLDTLILEAIAKNPGDVPLYESKLQTLPQIAKAETRNQTFRDNVTNFTLEVTFKPFDASTVVPTETVPETGDAAAAGPGAEAAASQPVRPAAAAAAPAQPASTPSSAAPATPPSEIPPPPPDGLPPPIPDNDGLPPPPG